MSTKVFKISPSVQNYDWGKIGNDSQVAQLASSASSFALDESKPYAELWMGTHSTSPSRVADSNILLSDHLTAHPELITSRIQSHFGKENGQLPFLFKVLSIAKALSIQTHPDKETAKKLHAERPDVYKDDNHKPEMALALTPFRALCGFLPLPTIAQHLSETPELAALIPANVLSAFQSIASSSTPQDSPQAKSALKDLFEAVMTAPSSTVTSNLSSLISRYKANSVSKDDEGVPGLVLRLDEQFPGDIGIFCAFILNYVTLQPGQAIFLGAGEPHAYISGDAMECMAASDNVIRAGLTPKLRDVPNLVSGLTYIPGPGTKHFTQPKLFSKGTTLYDPPIPEFSVLETKSTGGEKVMVRALDGPAIAIVQLGGGSVSWEGGEKLEVKRGDVVFIGAGTPVEWEGELVVYTAFVEVS